MLKSEHQERVELLMNQIPGQEIPSSPCILDEKNRILKAKLILEEALEKVEALGVHVCCPISENQIVFIDDLEWLFSATKEPNWLKVIDSCCDCIAISTSTLSRMGIPDLAVQKAVDDANLSKFSLPDCDKCWTTMIRSGLDQGFICINCGERKPKEAGPYLREDGKWVKPPYFVAPETRIRQIIIDLGFPESEL